LELYRPHQQMEGLEVALNEKEENVNTNKMNCQQVRDDRLHRLIFGLHLQSQVRWKIHLIQFYIFSLLSYIAVFLALLGVNFKPNSFIDKHYHLAFHHLAFWGVFVFTVIEAFILTLTNLVTKFQMYILGFNVVTTLTTVVLFSIYPHEYEVVTHYLEYTIQIFISAVNFLFVLNLMKRRDTSNVFYKYRYLELFAVCLVIVLSIFQLIFFTEAIPLGGLEGDRLAHFLEFINEIMNACFVLCFAFVTYSDFQKELRNCNRDYLEIT
jgi:glucan phosphoethanolaminetransferase (alkaline phosphatase superfamily)